MTTIKPLNGRGCGKRKANSPYLCSSLDKLGQPIDKFIIDPPIVWSEKTQRGFTLIDKDGVNNVLIVVGKGFYASPWDFIEEVKRFGVSRKVSKNFPFHKLTPGKSMMYFAHARCFPDESIILEHPNECTLLNYTSLFGWHNMNKFKMDVKFCTYGLKSLAIFHNNAIRKNSTYTINKQSFSYEVVPPLYIDRNVKVANGVSWSECGNIYTTDLLIDFRGLLPHPVPSINLAYKPNIGIFMAVPITNVEIYKSIEETPKKAILRSDYKLDILDY